MKPGSLWKAAAFLLLIQPLASAAQHPVYDGATNAQVISGQPNVSGKTAGQPPMHVPEPTVNLGGTSFLDALGGPGGQLEEIGDGYHSGENVDASGQLADLAATNSISLISHGVLLAKRRLLRAHYGLELLGVTAHVNAGDKGTAGGWGDLTVPL